MKKSLLALFMVPLLLASCSFGGGNDPEDDPNSAEGSKKLTIRFHVDAQSTEAKGYKKIIDAFNTAKASEGIKVTPSFVARTGSNDQYDQQHHNYLSFHKKPKRLNDVLDNFLIFGLFSLISSHSFLPSI